MATVVATLTASLGAQSPNALSGVPGADSIRLTLAEARQRAISFNPDFRANLLDTAIAAGELRQARTFPFNPSVDVLGSGGTAGAEYSTSQELEIFGQRGLRVRARAAGLQRARAAVTNHARLTIGDVDRAFFRLVSAIRTAKLAEDVQTLNDRLITIARQQLTEGEISKLDYNLAVVERGRSLARVSAARRERDGFSLELSRLLGFAPGTPISPVLIASEHPPILDSTTVANATGGDLVFDSATLNIDSLQAVALARRPDIVELRALTSSLRTDASLAAREALPNLIARATVQPGENGSRAVRPGIGMILPLFNRNRGEVAARRAAAAQAELRLAAAEARVRIEVSDAVRGYLAAATQVEILENTVLLPARQNRQLLEIAYREGKVGLPILLLIRSQVNDAEHEYWEAWLAERESGATLAEATAQNSRDFPLLLSPSNRR